MGSEKTASYQPGMSRVFCYGLKDKSIYTAAIKRYLLMCSKVYQNNIFVPTSIVVE